MDTPPFVLEWSQATSRRQLLWDEKCERVGEEYHICAENAMRAGIHGKSRKEKTKEKRFFFAEILDKSRICRYIIINRRENWRALFLTIKNVPGRRLFYFWGKFRMGSGRKAPLTAKKKNIFVTICAKPCIIKMRILCAASCGAIHWKFWRKRQ